MQQSRDSTSDLSDFKVCALLTMGYGRRTLSFPLRNSECAKETKDLPAGSEQRTGAQTLSIMVPRAPSHLLRNPSPPMLAGHCRYLLCWAASSLILVHLLLHHQWLTRSLAHSRRCIQCIRWDYDVNSVLSNPRGLFRSSTDLVSWQRFLRLRPGFISVWDPVRACSPVPSFADC